MPTVNETIAFALTASQALLNRYTADLKPEEYLHRPTPASNCAAWLIGHLTLTERNALKALGAGDLPPLPEGFEKRFSRDEGCAQAGDFGDATALMPLFNQHRERLIDAVRRATPQQLAAPLEKPRPLFNTVGAMAHFMAIHVAMHAGQITMIRRSLGRPPIM